MAKAESARLQWARIGAEARLRELEEERASILAVFPELRGAGQAATRRSGGRKRRTMSAAARRRMSAGMRKYWARRKALQKKT
jgi:hypothetical protein